ncbi:uncharacterized protein [Mobula birostris]|uniref:uncharacterized protein n=1 Tax=Mobula birostris TaxID=1983395 RepID=UPI003B28C275
MGVVPYLCLLLSCLAGVRSDIVLTQPESVVAKPGHSHRLTCAVSGFDISSRYMYWVKQVPGKGLEWLVSYYSESYKYYAPGIQSRFTASKGSSNFYLQMNNLRLDDTATYYCVKGCYYDVYESIQSYRRRYTMGCDGWDGTVWQMADPSIHKPNRTKLLELGSSGASTGLYPESRPELKPLISTASKSGSVLRAMGVIPHQSPPVLSGRRAVRHRADTARVSGGKARTFPQTDLCGQWVRHQQLLHELGETGPGKGLGWLLAYRIESYMYYAPGDQSRFTSSKDSQRGL